VYSENKQYFQTEIRLVVTQLSYRVVAVRRIVNATLSWQSVYQVDQQALSLAKMLRRVSNPMKGYPNR
jgi:hypothetical protein